MKKKKLRRCSYCEKDRERCKLVMVKAAGEPDWCCPNCWQAGKMELYIYEERTGDGVV